MTSDAESEIRESVVARLRELVPQARIVHELNVAGQGSNRIDVAAIGRSYIIGVEIKSERDTLSRLADQWAAFRKVCDVVIIAAHRKHFEEWRGLWQRADAPASLSLRHELGADYRVQKSLWCYPRITDLPLREFNDNAWTLYSFNPHRPSPRAAQALLAMLWRDELHAVCTRYRFAATKRSTCATMAYDLAMGLTGREVKEAVCWQLRQRSFARADDPVLDREAAE